MTSDTAMNVPPKADLPHSFLEEKRGPLPWIVLVAWAVWLSVLVVLAIPELGKSKADLLKLVEKRQAERNSVDRQ